MAALFVGLIAPTASAADLLIGTNAIWKYLDNGTDQGTNWITPSFDDSAWKSGPSELGYGDGDEATVVEDNPTPGYNPGDQDRYITTYFRHSFNVPDPSIYAVLLMRVRRDDGVLVFLNGREIFRNNLPPGDIAYNTPAFNVTDEAAFLPTNVPPSYLVPGQNVFAAEVHQSGPNSSDVSFYLDLTGNTQNELPTVALVSPGEGALYTAPATISMTASAGDIDGGVALVEFFQGTTKLGEDNTTPYNFTWSNVPVGSYALRAVATDNLGARATSAVVNVSVGVASIPTVASKTPAPGTVSSLASITVTFSENVWGVDASDLLINGAPAGSVTGSGTTYTFTLAQPAEGTVFVGWNGAHGIVDFENPPKPFDPFSTGATWQYTLTDTVAPTLASASPPAGATVGELDQIEVTFSEPVFGVDAADLRINGAPAISVSGEDAGPYEFQFATPANGTVNVTWTGGHGITDRAAARNAFVGAPWSYTLNTNAVWDGQIVINEIMYHPPHNQAAFAPEPVGEEYVELFNRGATAVNLAGWRLNRAVEFTFPNVNLPAGGYLVVAANVAAFQAKYPGVANVVGGWTGRLSNSRDEVELEDPSGNQVDLVEYADEGDWAVRTATGAGWEWVSAADGFGSSLELRQSGLDNSTGQNWRTSTANNGTPGAVNSVATANVAPLVLGVSHLPAVPRSTNSVTILARITDESASGLTVRLWRRDAATSDPFVSVAMLDNGASNDGAPNDGLYGVVLAPQANGAITEFYIEATDAGSNTRTWPAAADLGGGNFAQEANALFQVDDEFYAGKQPVYRIIMRPSDRNNFFGNFDRVQRNATLITVEGSDVQIRHSCFTRRRGASSFGSTPPTMKFGIPRDRPWNNKTSMNLNSVNTYAQVLGAAVALKAGLPAPHTRAVQVRFNGVNEAPSGGGMFGSYAHVEVVDGEWARDHFPNDGNGNVYSKRRPECGGLEYLEPGNPQNYVNCAYDKESNASESDWADLINLTFAMDPETTPDNDYVRAVRRNLNVELALRYFAVLFLMNYTETAIANGADDDYDLYRGTVDPRFMLLPHDFDQIFGSDQGQPSTADNLFIAGNQPNINRFLRHPEFEPLFYAEYRKQLAGTFSTNQLFALFDQVLGDWVPVATINARKANALNRITYASGAVPLAPAVARATISGEPDSPAYQNTATLNVGGTDITHYRYRVNNGAWSADTVVSQPINLNGLANGHYTVYVVGRNSTGSWQADADATISKTWAVLSSLRRVVINEVLARNDSAVNHEGTFPDIIELYNASASSVDLSGLRLTDDLDDPNKFTFPAGTTLAAGAYRVVFANNPDGTSGLHTGFGLDQDGDELYLLDRATNGVRVIDSVTFGWQLPNLSIGRLGNGQWGLCMPTSGGANTATLTGPTATLKINEWLASPASPFVDDFAELYNPDTLPVNLGGLFMTDQPIGDPFRHRIAPLSFIDGFGYRVFIADGDQGAGPDHLDFSLAAETGEIALLNSSGAIIDCVVYGQQFAGVSQGRSPNGGSRIVYFDLPTPGAGNPAAPGPVNPSLVNIIPIDHTWRYEASNTDLGTAWTNSAYNDSAWPTGQALIGYENNPPAIEPIRTLLTQVNGRVTTYYRTRFDLPAGVNLSGLEITHVLDDGAVFYVNGAEIGRFSMPAGPVNFTTLGNTVVDAAYVGGLQVPLNLVQPTGNVLAVELHQNNLNGSADALFGLRLEAVIITNNPALAGIKINEILANARNTTNTDGTVTDWVELYNPSNAQIDLSGMSFTDQLANPRRWVFPQGSVIIANGYRVVRFDSDAPATTNFAAVLNTGFGMKASGDSLYFFNRPQSGGELLDAISFGIQAPDWSIGRVPNGGSNWVLNVPSPGSLNIAASLGNPGLLKINEWMADPGSGQPDWFEIHNPNPQPVELSGLYLTDDLNNRLQYPPIPARSYIAAGLSGFLRIIADNNPAAGPDHVPFALSRNGESLGISDRFGNLIDQVTFGTQFQAVSQGRLPDGTTNIVFFVGTPTPDESNYLPIPNVVINEVLTHTDLPLEDAIELHNTSASAVNIGGWYLSDKRTALRKYRIPNGTTIPANGFRVFYENQFNPIPGDPTGFSLSSARGDQVYLSAADGAGVLTGYRTVVDFGPAANGVSFGRYITSPVNGNKVEFTALAGRTFGVDNPPTVDDFRTGTGRTNSGPRVGPVVISEIMYHPPDLPGGVDDVAGEFIELRNITGSAVPLYDPAFPTNVWRLKDAVSFNFPPNRSIPANGIIVVVSFNPTDTVLSNAFRARYSVPAGTVILGPYNGKLDNSADSVELARPDSPQTVPGPDFGFVPYILVDKVKYSDSAPWPTAPDGAGQSLTRITPGNYGNDPVNWTAAAPTPGPQGGNPDTDGDGMDDAWEQQYFGNLARDGSGDFDGDGVTDLQEFIAGTDPTTLRLTILSAGPTVLRFGAAANRAYTVEYRNNLNAGSWTLMQNVAAGAARIVQMTNSPAGTTNRFYRVRTP